MLTVLKLACKIAANLLLLEQKGLQVTDSARGLLLFDAWIPEDPQCMTSQQNFLAGF